MKSGKLVLGILGGAASGVALGLFLASDKGSETRKRISKIADDYKDEIQSLFDFVVKNISSKYESTKEDADEFLDKSKTRINEGYNQFKKEYHDTSILPKNDLNK